MKSKVLIVIPALNEEVRIGALLRELCLYQSDVLVVDDGSADLTGNVVQETGFRVIRNEKNEGLSSVYYKATLFAKENGYTHILSLDADGQHDPKCIPQFMEAMNRFDFVSGKRFQDPESVPPLKIASNLFAILLIGEVVGKQLPDVSCGYRGWKVDIFPDTEMMFKGLYENCRFGIIYKMLIEAVLNGIQPGFVPVPVIYHPEVRLNTKTNEIIGLIHSVLKYKSISSVEEFLKLIQSGNEAEIELNGIRFILKPDTEDAFIFHTDQGEAKRIFHCIN